MSKDDYDLIVIGGGSGGVRAARLCGASGMKVAICETSKLGGTCVNRGCVPKKLLHGAGHLLHQQSLYESFGITAQHTTFDWQTLQKNIQTYITRLNQSYHNLLEANHVEIISGFAKIVAERTVAINGREIRAKRILLAVGGVPSRLDVAGCEHALVSDDIFDLKALPSSMVVVGGGYIAVELATILHALGVKITLVHRGQSLLKHFDMHTTQQFTQTIQEAGIDLYLESNISSISLTKNNFVDVELDSNRKIHAEKILLATGRRPNLDGLGLENISCIAQEQFFTGNKIRVNAHYQTAVPWLYALGDITAIAPELTPVAIRQGMIFHAHLTGKTPPLLNPSLIPTAVFSLPTMAFVGMSEEQAYKHAEEHKELVTVWLSKFTPMDIGFASSSKGIKVKNRYKFVTLGAQHEIVGIFLLGALVDELLQPLATLLEKKASIADLNQTLAIHPTLSEELLNPQMIAQKQF